jgi:hypothetical protein
MEADAVAVSNMQDYSTATFATNVRGMSNVVDPVAREAVYTEVLTALHDEAIFLPLTAKRQTAVTNKGVAGFKFGFMEYDLPLANLHPSDAPYPYTYINCGVSTTITAAPTKAVVRRSNVPAILVACMHAP